MSAEVVLCTHKTTSLPVWIILSQLHHRISTNSQPFLVGIVSKANAANHPTWEQAMNGPEANGYWEACKKELNTLETKRDAWEVVKREPWMKVLPSTWAFCCKRYPDGSVRKLKARIFA